MVGLAVVLVIAIGVVIAIGLVVQNQPDEAPARVDAIDDAQVLAWIDAAAAEAETIEEPTERKRAARRMISLWESAGYFGRAEALWPKLGDWSREARVGRGYSLMYRGRVDEGFAQFRRYALPEEFEKLRVYALRGLIRHDLTDEAMARIGDCESADEQDNLYLRAAKWYAERGQIGKAEQAAAKIVDEAERARVGKHIDYMRQAVEGAAALDSPDDEGEFSPSEAWRFAAAFARLGAEALTEQALSRGRLPMNRALAHANVAFVYAFELGEPERAGELAARAARIMAEQEIGTAMKARLAVARTIRVLARVGRADEARQVYQQHGEVLDNDRPQALAELGEHEAAVEALIGSLEPGKTAWGLSGLVKTWVRRGEDGRVAKLAERMDGAQRRMEVYSTAAFMRMAMLRGEAETW